MDSTPNNGSTTEDDDDCETVSTTPVIDLELTKTANTTTPVIGQDVTFTISVVNKGPSNATGVTVSDVLPTGLQFVSANPAAAYNSATGAWTIGNLAVNATTTLQIVAKPTTTDQVRNYAQVATANETDIDSTPGNNSTTEDDDDAVILSTRPQIDLELTKTANTTSPQIGGTVTFTIGVINKGPAAATGVSVKDLLPTGLTFVSATAAKGTYNFTTGLWTIGNMTVNESTNLQITATVDTGNAVTNYAQIQTANEQDIDSTPGNNSTTEDDDDQVTIRGTAKIDLELKKTVNNATPDVNSNVIFTITVDNKGPNAATGVVVKDVLPAGLAFVSASATQGSFANTTGLWTIGNMAVNQQVRLDITATVTTTNTVTNYAQVNAANETDIDSTPGNNSTTEDDDDQVTLSGKPVIDLELTKTVNTTTPTINGDVTYTITVVNKGPSPATGVTVSDLLQTGQTFKSATATVGSYNSATGAWTIGNLAVGQTVRLDVVTTVTVSTPIRNYAQIATANEEDIDSTPGNNSTTEDDDDATLIQAAKKIDLELTKSVSNQSPVVGQNVIFTISLVNKGPSDATNVTVKDVLPAGVTFVSASAGQGAYDNASGIWNVGNLTNGQSTNLQITATVNTRNVITNYAQVNSANETDIDSTPGNNSTTEDDDDSVSLQGTPRIDLELTKTVDNTKPAVNSNVTFTLTLVNKGPNDASGVEVKDLLPAGLSFVSAAPTQGSYVSSTGLWTVGNLIVNQTVQMTLVAKVTTTGSVTNYTQVNKANETDVDSTPGNNSTTEDDDDQVTLSGDPRIDLSLTKAVNNATPVAGTNVTFTVTVKNDGGRRYSTSSSKSATPAC